MADRKLNHQSVCRGVMCNNDCHEKLSKNKKIRVFNPKEVRTLQWTMSQYEIPYITSHSYPYNGKILYEKWLKTWFEARTFSIATVLEPKDVAATIFFKICRKKFLPVHVHETTRRTDGWTDRQVCRFLSDRYNKKKRIYLKSFWFVTDELYVALYHLVL